MSYPKIIENLIEQLSRLPSIGRRSAERMIFWFLDQPKETVQELVDSLILLKNKLYSCRQCNNLSDDEICSICRNVSRERNLLCVVETPKDVMAIEKTGAYKGLYYVLLGNISPADGRGPEDLKIGKLMELVRQGTITEVIIATDPDNEGEMTALYLIKMLKPLGVKITRIGFGLPVGGAVEYADASTLSLSVASRREIG